MRGRRNTNPEDSLSSFGWGLTAWFSPHDQPIALRYEREDESSPWIITGLVAVSRSPAGLGSAWMKAFQWRGLASPFLGTGVFWRGEPTVEVLDEVYDENGHMRKQTKDLDRFAYVHQIDPVTDAREVFGHNRASRGMDKALEWDEMHIRLKAEGADEATIKEAEKDFFYRRVADVYLHASSSGHSPVVAVAEAWDAPRTSASNWVREARARGYLPPTQRGRAT